MIVAMAVVGQMSALAAPSALAETAPLTAAEAAMPPDCDPANASAADAGCKAPAPRGNAAAPQPGGEGRRGTCETMNGDKFDWSQPNVPFGAARCEATDAAPPRQEKSPQAK